MSDRLAINRDSDFALKYYVKSKFIQIVKL